MARSTFDGPILSGATRFGEFRSVGYASLAQQVALDFSLATGNYTVGYAGASGQFVRSNAIPNTATNIYVPSPSVYPPAVQAIPTDTATNIYRGAVMYIPHSSQLVDCVIDYGTLVTLGTGTLTSVTVYVSNAFTAAAGTPTYYATGALTAVGRQPLATFTTAQIANQLVTSQDIPLAPGTLSNGAVGINSQIVITIAIVGTGMTTLSTGQFNVILKYRQIDYNIGSQTSYPYGNLD